MDRAFSGKSRNFEFLRQDNEILAELAGCAEAVLHVDPGSALTRLRSFAEEVTKSIYEEEYLPRLPQASFYELLKSRVFEDCVDRSLIHQINFLRVQGNETAHGAKGELRSAQVALGTAHQLALYMALKYYGKTRSDIAPFKEITDPTAQLSQLKKSVGKYQAEVKEQAARLEEVIEQLEKERTRNSANIEPPHKQDAARRQAQSHRVADSLQWDEAKTRRLLIDTLLAKAGWDLNNPEQVTLEFEVPKKQRADRRFLGL